MGKKLVSWATSVVSRIPVVRSIYSSVKQVSDTLFSESGNAFRTAVLVQWPRPDVWTIGFVTGTPGGDVTNYLVGDYLSVYVPTTPNPTGGYFVMLRKSDCVELKMSVDDALKYVISMGVVAPSNTVTEDDAPLLAARPSTKVSDVFPENAYDLLRSRHRSPAGPDHHPVRLGEPPARPRRRDLRGPARPRRLRAGRVRPGSRRDFQGGRGPAQRVLRPGQGPGARAPRGHDQRPLEERQDRNPLP